MKVGCQFVKSVFLRGRDDLGVCFLSFDKVFGVMDDFDVIVVKVIGFKKVKVLEIFMVDDLKLLQVIQDDMQRIVQRNRLVVVGSLMMECLSVGGRIVKKLVVF